MVQLNGSSIQLFLYPELGIVFQFSFREICIGFTFSEKRKKLFLFLVVRNRETCLCFPFLLL